MPTLHPHPEDPDDLESMTLCDRCGEEVPVNDTSAGLSHWFEWPDATLCPDCWVEAEDEERIRQGFMQDSSAVDERLTSNAMTDYPTLAERLARIDAELKPFIDASFNLDLVDRLTSTSAPWYELVIAYNSVVVNGICPVCGTRKAGGIGPELMLDSSRMPVCFDCGLKYAPELVRLLMQGGLCDEILHADQPAQ